MLRGFLNGVVCFCTVCPLAQVQSKQEAQFKGLEKQSERLNYEHSDDGLLRVCDLDRHSVLNSDDLSAWVASPSDLNDDSEIKSADATLLINAMTPR